MTQHGGYLEIDDERGYDRDRLLRYSPQAMSAANLLTTADVDDARQADVAAPPTVVPPSDEITSCCSISKLLLALLGCILEKIFVLINNLKGALDKLCGERCQHIRAVFRCVIGLILQGIIEFILFIVYLILMPFRFVISLAITIANEICCIVGNGGMVLEVFLQVLREISPNLLQCGAGWDIGSVCDKRPPKPPPGGGNKSPPPIQPPCNDSDDADDSSSDKVPLPPRPCGGCSGQFSWRLLDHLRRDRPWFPSDLRRRRNEQPSGIPRPVQQRSPPPLFYNEESTVASLIDAPIDDDRQHQRRHRDDDAQSGKYDDGRSRTQPLCY